MTAKATAEKMDARKNAARRKDVEMR